MKTKMKRLGLLVSVLSTLILKLGAQEIVTHLSPEHYLVVADTTEDLTLYKITVKNFIDSCGVVQPNVINLGGNGGCSPIVINNCNTRKVFKALISQSGTDDPIFIDLDNSLGFNPMWVRANTGIYRFTAPTALFPSDSTFLQITPSTRENAIFEMFSGGADNQITIRTYDGSVTPRVLQDDLLDRNSIYIECFKK